MALGTERHSLLKECNGSVLMAISRMGGRVEIVSNPEVLLSVSDDMSFIVEGSPLTSLRRDALTYATAIGHFHLHAFSAMATVPQGPKKVMRIAYDVDESDQDLLIARYEAYWFALSFLMPVGDFEDVLSADGAEKAARRFGVTLPVVGLRAAMGK